MKRPFAAAVLACAAALAGAGCRTEQIDEPVGLALARPLHLDPQRAWRVLDDGQAVGVVVRFAAPEAPDDPRQHFYSVRNDLQQELGWIDGLGRAWRYELHQPRPVFVGTGTVLEGARSILSLGGGALLEELAFGENAGAAPRP